ncbi:MAG: NUDIX hydrolase [Candidatus Uhrbacteria bacterium]|nr:NUDIX hydrolase [Candidatus Uhrbacteria bacterium]
MPNLAKYTTPMIAADVVLFTVKDGQLNVLLIKMKKHPFEKMWAAPGGMIKGNESPDDAAHRLLVDKTGVDNVYLEQLFTFGDVKRDPFGRVISIGYMALVPSEHLVLATNSDYDGVAWFPVNKLPPLAYDHTDMIALAIDRLKSKLGYTNIAKALLPDKFPFSRLQHVYESILGKALDKRNFTTRMIALSLVIKTREFEKHVAYRPAQLYRFKSAKMMYVDIV